MSCQTKSNTVYFTEGDDLPSLLIGFPFDISTFSVSVLVERPDGSTFERVAVVLNANQAQVNWVDSDWVEGCSILWVKTANAGGQVQTAPPVNVVVGRKPQATP